MGIAYRWRGERTPGERGWQEWFPGKKGLPDRDLTVDDVAALTDDQKMLLTSAAGKRLYEPVETKDDAPAPRAKRPRVKIDDGEAETPAAGNGATDGHE